MFSPFDPLHLRVTKLAYGIAHESVQLVTHLYIGRAKVPGRSVVGLKLADV
jgi:hypothetical protein